MIAIKIQCGCGQKYAFDVEPVSGRMPAAVACPVCGDDGTVAANSVIAQSLPPPVEFAPADSNPARVALSGSSNGSGLRVSGLARPAPGVHLTATAPEPVPVSRGPSLRSGQIDRTQAEHEARAKISWGDSQEEVVKFLMIQGLTYQEAQDVVGPMFKERAKTVRLNGIKKIFIGIFLACVPIVALVVFLSMGYIPLKIFAVTVIIGLYGLWLILKGTIMMIAPKSEPGDVAEQ